MNKQQRDAVAWDMLAGGGTYDTLDLQDCLEEWNSRGGIDIEMTDDDIEAIIEQVQSMHRDIETKAQNKFNRAFKRQLQRAHSANRAHASERGGETDGNDVDYNAAQTLYIG